MADLAIRCACGQVEGRVLDARPETTSHVVCYCRSCRAFAKHLGATPFDAQDGAEILQVTGGSMRIDKGLEKLHCLRLSEKGMLRWYAGCCGTPVGTTVTNAGIAIAGLTAACLPDPVTLEEVTGPIRARYFISHAPGDQTALALRRGSPVRASVHVVWRALLDRLRGRHRDHPLIKNGEPVAKPHILTPEERDAAYHPR